MKSPMQGSTYLCNRGNFHHLSFHSRIIQKDRYSNNYILLFFLLYNFLVLPTLSFLPPWVNQESRLRGSILREWCTWNTGMHCFFESTPLCFNKRPTLVPGVANWKKSKVDFCFYEKRQKVTTAFCVYFAANC